MFNGKVVLILCAALVGLSGCVVVPTPRVAYVETRVMVAPPPPRVEIVPAAPASHWYWVGGHWKWENNGYVWVAGHWVEPRPKEAFVQAQWSRDGGGYWQRFE
jgi:hypothetical protein